MNSVVGKFEKVSFEQFSKDLLNCDYYPGDKESYEKEARRLYDSIKLPKRATTGSAGYDFYLPIDSAHISGIKDILIPTGIRVKIEEGWFLGMFPRSGLGFKYRLSLNNTVGIIDSDYYNSSNEGHIMAKLNIPEGRKFVVLKHGDAFMQGIFLPYGVTEDDDSDGVRDGGFGSTSNS